MSNFNKGEWSEIYTILFLLIYPDLVIANSKLNAIAKDLYKLKEIKRTDSFNGVFEYILKGNDVEIHNNDKLEYVISLIELNENKNKILQAINNAPSGDGAFEIEGIDGLLYKLTKGEKLKAKSLSKEDLEAIVHDFRLGRDADLKYSIKSSLGRPATLLNSSQRTNFLYSVEGLSDEQAAEINAIDTSSKLLDRIKLIEKYGGVIKFEKVTDEIFDYNLKMIDSKMPEYLGNAILDSYIKNEKNLKELFLNSNQFSDSAFAMKKLGQFLEAVSFGFLPGKKWDGFNEVNGGLLIVKSNGNVVVLDLVYYRKEVLNYIIEETKLDTPSTTRYHQLELSRKGDKHQFTLNLQVRYKK